MTLMVSLFTDVDEETGIAPPCMIEPTDSGGIHHGCWISAYLAPRSPVYGGDAMTMKTQMLERFKLQS